MMLASSAMRILVVAALVVTACTPTETTTRSDEAPAPAATDEPPATESDAADGRRFVVDWQRAAETSAGGLERDVVPLLIEMPLPAGWYSAFGWAVNRANAQPPAGAGITFERPLALYADRCRWDEPDGLIEIGPTVDELVDALIEHPQYGATNVADITVSGFVGKQLDMLGVPDGFDVTRCSPGTRPDGSQAPHLHRPWAGRYWMGPTEMNRVRVLDVAGERVVIRAMFFDGTSEEEMAALIEILDSIAIETNT